MNDMVLPVDSLPYIHQWLPFDSGVLFPFEQNDHSPEGRIKAMLTKGNILTSDGSLTPKATNLFSVIAEAEKTARLKFLAEGDLVDFQVFFSKDKSTAVSIQRAETGFICSSPGTSPELIDIISDFSGTSSAGVIDASFLISHSEAVVMGAILDAVRSKIFTSLGKFEETFRTTISIDSITKLLQVKDKDPRWFSWVIAHFIPEELHITSVTVDETLTGLCEKNLIKTEDSRITVRDDILFLARRLLHLNCLYLLDTFTVTGGKGQRTRLAIVQNGPRDLLLLETDGKSIGWQGICGSVLFSILWRELAPESAPISKGNISSTSTTPSQSIPPEKTDLSEQTVCPQCNKERKPGAKFCTGCGHTFS